MITLSQLQREHPDWTWAARKRGFGWCYEGRKGASKVSFQAHSVADEFGEHCRTQWVGRDGESFTFWSMRNRWKAQETT